MTRRRKLLLLLVLAPLALVALVVVAALTPAFQTFVARKALDGQGTVERIAVGTGGATITGLVIEQPGVKISLPSLRADVPLVAAARGSIKLSSLVARDIVIDYDPVAAAAHAAAQPPAEPPAAPAKPFAGILNAVELPALTADGIDLAGVLRVAGPQPFTARFSLSGGGLAAGKEGRLELKVTAEAARGSDVSTTVSLLPTLDAAGQLSALAVLLDASAKGFLLSKPSTLRGEVAIARDGVGESWRVRLIAQNKNLLELDTRWAPGAASLPGKWKLDITDADLAPFSPLPMLPTLLLAGAGDLTLTDDNRLSLSGDLRVAVDGVESLGLPELGALALTTSFDLAASATEAKINAFKLEVVSVADPVLMVEAKQAFTYDLATSKITSTRATEELLAVRLLSVPAQWVKMFVPDLTLGEPSFGAWSVRPDGDAIAIESTAPFVLSKVRYGTDAEPLLALDALQVDGLSVRADAAGYVATVAKLSLVAQGVDIVSVKANAAQKKGAPLVLHAQLTALLAPLTNQPALSGQTRISAGRALVILDATVAESSEVAAEVRISGLRAAGSDDLPDVLMQAEVKQDAAGAITLKLPLTVTNRAPQRISDLELSATVAPVTDTPTPTRHVVAKLSAQTLHVPDLQAFAALATETAPSSPQAPAEPVEPADAPLWAGVTGELEIALDRIVYGPGIEFTNTNGRLALTQSDINLERMRTLLGTGGGIDISGALRWLDSSRTYALDVRMSGQELAAGPLLKALNPTASVPLEGIYELAGTVKGEGIDPASAALAAAIDLRLKGSKGMIRSLDFDTNRFARAGSTVAGVAGLLGTLSGNPAIAEKAAMVTALNNVVRSLTNLAYDEFDLAVSRAPSGAVEIGKFSIVSPTLRIDGDGGLGNLAGLSLWQQPLKLNLQLGARESLARDFTILRILKPLPLDATAADYAALVEPVTLDGTLRNISTTQLTRLLARHLTQ